MGCSSGLDAWEGEAASVAAPLPPGPGGLSTGAAWAGGGWALLDGWVVWALGLAVCARAPGPPPCRWWGVVGKSLKTWELGGVGTIVHAHLCFS